jgi:hypothetical protein
MDGEVNSLSDCGICSSIEEMELQWGYGVRGNRMFINEGSIYETIGGAGVYSHGDRGNVIRNQIDRGHK